MNSLRSSQSIPLYLTYDDVLLVPQLSTVKSRREISVVSKLSKNVSLQIPIVASNMDTVTEARMAIAMALEGGIGIIHRFCSIEEQCEMIQQVKRAQSTIIEDPRTIYPWELKEDAIKGFNWSGRPGGVKCLLVINKERKLLGLITQRDVRLADEGAAVSDMMVPRKDIIVSTETNISAEAARAIMYRCRISNLPLVDQDNRLRGLITLSDVLKTIQYQDSSKNKSGQLLVGAAVGVKKDDIARAEALASFGADVLVIDIAHGHSEICLNMIRKLKSNPKTKHLDIIAGNIATAEAAKELIKAGADGLKVGVGPGSICITRLVAGAGVPQLSAIMEVANVAKAYNVPVIADGGIKKSGDICKAIAAGANTVMLGNVLAGTDESPGRILIKDGRKVKVIRGMAGYGANISKAEREKREDDVHLDLVPEGVEGVVPLKGPVAGVLKQLIGGLRSGISYCGSKSVPEMQQKAKFVRMTPLGVRESGHHDISKI